MLEQVLTVLAGFFGVMLGLLPYVIRLTTNITILTEKAEQNDKDHVQIWNAINEVKRNENTN